MLPESKVKRTHIHTRQVVFRGFSREDGLWDIEAQMRDTKPMFFDIPGHRSWQPEESIHDMSIRLTVDNELTVKEIAVSMDANPHLDCPLALDPVQKIVGAKLGFGWRKTIEQHLGNIAGCAHIRELLFNMATAAFQSIPGGLSANIDPEHPPHHLGKCKAWDFNGQAVLKYYPDFHGWKPKTKKE